MVCPGGEAAFVGAMVADSLVLRGRVHWHTAMLGRKASLKALRTALHRLRPTALRTTEFAQGAPLGLGPSTVVVFTGSALCILPAH